MQAVSIYDIVHKYIETFYKNERLDKEQKKTIHAEVKRLLSYGWCSSELYDVFKRANRKDATLKVSTLFRSKRPKSKNLLEPGKFYYHNDLRITSKPPKREIDYDSGEIRVINEPYFLEMKASYTVDDLISYYIRQVGRGSKQDFPRFRGSFEWLLRSFTLEEILFMIDTTVNMCQSEDMPLPMSPLDIQKYYREAKIIRTEKKTETVLAGGKKIVRKRRTRSS